LERREYIENLENKVKLFHCSKIPSFFPPKDQEKERRRAHHQAPAPLPVVYPYSCFQSRWWSLARSRPFFPGIAVHLAATPPGLFIPLPGLAIPHHKRSRAQATRSTTPSSAPVPARDQHKDQHGLLQRQLRVRRRLQVRHRMRRVRI